MLSQLSYFPTWTPQRGVARYVCHSLAAVKSFLCTGHPSVRREEPAIRGMQGPVATKSAPAAGGHACTSGHQDGKEAPCPLLAPVVSKAFSPWYAGRRVPAFPECLRESWGAPKQAGISTPCPPGYRASPGRVFRPATFTPRRTKTVASPGPLLPPSLKKIGRAAPVGLGYREKKRYRSPLVSL